MGERGREGKREKEGMRESESTCDGDDDETGEASRKRSFTVESKTFELALDERKGRCQILIVEKKRGGLDMGSIRARKLRAFQGGANPLYTR